MHTIMQDERHYAVNIIKECSIKSREFKQWNMASQLMTKPLLSYLLAEDITHPTTLFNLFNEKNDLAENLFLKVRDHYLTVPSYQLT